MFPMLASAGADNTDLTAVLNNAVQIMGKAVTVITDNTILFAIFGTSLLIAGFKVFKRAKNAVK